MLAFTDSFSASQRVAAAMKAAAPSISSKVLHTVVATRGAHVVHSQGPHVPPGRRPTRAPVEYRSTRSSSSTGELFTFEGVVMRGMAPDGGLFVPCTVRRGGGSGDCLSML